MKETNRIVWVTGASRGIGKAIAKKFLENGDNVIVHSYKHSESIREEFSSYEKAFFVTGDISSREDIDRVYLEIEEKFSGVDILINNAGVAWYGLFMDMTEEEWDNIMDTNVKGMFYTCKKAIPNMVSNKDGKIINISSMWGMTGASCEVAYSTAKAAIIGFTKAIAKELGPSQIKVNCVAPGVVRTDMMSDFTDDDILSLCDDTALCKIGEPEDISEAVFFLASRGADFMTGQVLSVNGGYLI